MAPDPSITVTDILAKSSVMQYASTSNSASASGVSKSSVAGRIATGRNAGQRLRIAGNATGGPYSEALAGQRGRIQSPCQCRGPGRGPPGTGTSVPINRARAAGYRTAHLPNRLWVEPSPENAAKVMRIERVRRSDQRPDRIRLRLSGNPISNRNSTASDRPSHRDFGP